MKEQARFMEKKLMFMDTNGMYEKQHAYVELCRDQVLAKKQMMTTFGGGFMNAMGGMGGSYMGTMNNAMGGFSKGFMGAMRASGHISARLYIRVGGRARRQTNAHGTRCAALPCTATDDRLLFLPSMASSSSRLVLLAFAFLLAVAVPSVDAWGGRLFFSKMTRPEAVVEADKAADTTTAGTSTEAFDANGAPAFPSRPSSGNGNRGYGLYGRPEESEKYPPAYFRRGVHHDAEKRTTTNVVVPEAAAREDAAAAGFMAEEEEASMGEKEEEPSFPENGSGRGRPLSYMRHHGGKHDGDYGMSDTRLYQNGRYYYDVETDKYGYGSESNPVHQTRAEPEEDNGSGYGRAGGDRRRERYGDDGAVEKQNNDDGFQENQNGQYNP
uniref:Uncharacterized protein n=1 Tax=Avena sativa TaxID=4498 RepID=A0ACD5VHV3_AVESA